MVRRRRLATRYTNRSTAGRLLGETLATEAVLERPVVLALPRGGVPVAAEVAVQLNAPLGVILVRKIGVPGRSELAMGALAMVDGQLSEFRNDEIVDGLGISRQTFDAARDRERLELERRASVFSSKNLNVAGATVIVVDDGLATVSTMLAAVSAVRGLEPSAVVVASKPVVRSSSSIRVTRMLCTAAKLARIPGISKSSLANFLLHVRNGSPRPPGDAWLAG